MAVALYLVTVDGDDYAALQIDVDARNVAYRLLGVDDPTIPEGVGYYEIDVTRLEFSTEADRDAAVAAAGIVGELIDYDHAKTRTYEFFEADEVDAWVREFAGGSSSSAAEELSSSSATEELSSSEDESGPGAA